MFYQESIRDRLVQIYHQKPEHQEWLVQYLSKKDIEIKDLIEISIACDLCLEWISTGRN